MSTVIKEGSEVYLDGDDNKYVVTSIEDERVKLSLKVTDNYFANAGWFSLSALRTNKTIEKSNGKIRL